MEKVLLMGTAEGKYLNVHYEVRGKQLMLNYEIIISNLMKKKIEEAICFCFQMKAFSLDDMIGVVGEMVPADWVAERVQAVTDYLDRGARLLV